MDGIVLLAKKPGLTSFASLSNIKKAVKTTKVGHTGTLDSFAQGLLVVCTGRLTRLAGNIVEFDKSYKAVIKFGQETDTLEYTGKVIKSTRLPTKEEVIAAVKHFTGEQMQRPPLFSAIHINGNRASDLARSGCTTAEIPERKITVFSAEIIDFKLNENNEVEACMVDFSVSKGTYIRSLARDIGDYCNSSAHLIGLYRTRIGNFSVENAAALNELEDFTIENCYKQADFYSNNPDFKTYYGSEIQQEILSKLQKFKKSVSEYCGFMNIDLTDENAAAEFKNGKPLKNRLFVQDLYEIPNNSEVAVFYQEEFCGLLNKNDEGRIKYKFVIN